MTWFNRFAITHPELPVAHSSATAIDVSSTPVATMVTEQLSPEDRAEVALAVRALSGVRSDVLVPLSSTHQNMDRLTRQYKDKYPDAELFMVRAGRDLRLLVLTTKDRIVLVDVIRKEQLDYFMQ